MLLPDWMRMHIVERIINMKYTEKGMFYHVLWEGYEKTTWEPEKNFCEELLKNYKIQLRDERMENRDRRREPAPVEVEHARDKNASLLMLWSFSLSTTDRQ